MISHKAAGSLFVLSALTTTNEFMIISAGKSTEKSGTRLERGAGFPHWTAGFFLSGLTETVCGEETWLLPGKSCAILEPNTPYTRTLKKPQNEVWMIFDPRASLLNALRSRQGAPGTFYIAFRDPEIWKLVQAGLGELLRWWGAQPPQLLLAENAMERVLLLAKMAQDRRQGAGLDERIAHAIAYINERIGEELCIEVLARVAGLSPSRFSHLFRETMGLAPMKFLEKRRIERARHLLLTSDLPVQQVGFNTGFPNAQHFSIRFRKLTGQSPSAFRQRPSRRFGELNPQRDGDGDGDESNS